MRKMSFVVAIILVLALVAGMAIAAKSKTPAKKGKGPGTEVVNVKEVEYSITLNPSTVRPGKVMFKVKNDGKIVHQFEIKGNGIDKKITGDIKPGQTRQLTVTLKPGKYTVWCPVDEHEAKGMKTTLTVK